MTIDGQDAFDNIVDRLISMTSERDRYQRDLGDERQKRSEAEREANALRAEVGGLKARVATMRDEIGRLQSQVNTAIDRGLIPSVVPTTTKDDDAIPF